MHEHDEVVRLCWPPDYAASGGLMLVGALARSSWSA